MLNPRVLLVFGVTVMVLSGSAPFLQIVAAQTKSGCTSRCGDLNIPYPFGTTDGGSDCYYNGSELHRPFVIFCDKSTDHPVPYLYEKPADFQVVNISVGQSRDTCQGVCGL